MNGQPRPIYVMSLILIQTAMKPDFLEIAKHDNSFSASWAWQETPPRWGPSTSVWVVTHSLLLLRSNAAAELWRKTCLSNVLKWRRRRAVIHKRESDVGGRPGWRGWSLIRSTPSGPFRPNINLRSLSLAPTHEALTASLKFLKSYHLVPLVLVTFDQPGCRR